MDILDQIINYKKKEVSHQKTLQPVKKLESSEYFRRKGISFRDALIKPGPSIIGEFKRKSPSGGIINSGVDPFRVASDYKEAGLDAVSVLTDNRFFGGTQSDLSGTVDLGIPVLRKDFIIDEYQVIESKSLGASAILLIAAALTGQQVLNLFRLSRDLGMDVLFEIHEISDIDKLFPDIELTGVNNRDLRSLDVTTERSLELLPHLPPDCIKVSESGLSSAIDVANLYRAGYDAFLIGSTFMRADNPGFAAARFLNDLRISIS